MAKPRKSKSGIYTLTVAFNRQRRNLTLGLITLAEARQFAANINVLTSHCRQNKNTIPPALVSWVSALSPKHREQLGEIGLLSKHSPAMTVGELMDAFLQHYETTDNAQSTKTQFESALSNRFPRRLRKSKLADIEPTQLPDRPNAAPKQSDETKSLFRYVESWQREHYAKSSWSRANGRLREVGKWAVGEGICNHNPFSMLKKPGETNSEKNVHVDAETILDVMDHCLDPDTRIALVIGRFAGCRTPSELRTLKWSMVDFDKGKLNILDSKKRKIRTMPLFDRLRDELHRHRESTTGNRFVLTDRARFNSDANNFNLIKEAVARAGVELWPRLRQNLRSSCENDLLQVFPERLVTQWIGHTVAVSRKHYQKLQDSDYEMAIENLRSRS